MARSRMPLLAAIALLGPLAAPALGSIVEPTITDDESALLQADVVVKAKAGRFDADIPRTTFCPPSTSDSEASECAVAEAAMDESLLATRTDAISEPMSTAVPNSSTIGAVRAFLLLLTCALVGDGARRRHTSMRAAGGSMDPKVDFSTSAAAQDSDSHPSFAAREVRTASPEDDADQWGTTALHVAARSGDLPAIEALLKRGANVDPVDCMDETPLHLAAREGHVAACALLVAKGASLRAINAQDWTPLVAAGHAGKALVCERLLDFGACAANLSEEDLPHLVIELIANRMLASGGPEEE